MFKKLHVVTLCLLWFIIAAALSIHLSCAQKVQYAPSIEIKTKTESWVPPDGDHQFDWVLLWVEGVIFWTPSRHGILDTLTMMCLGRGLIMSCPSCCLKWQLGSGPFTFWPKLLQRCLNFHEPSLCSGHGTVIIKHFFNVSNSFHPKTLGHLNALMINCTLCTLSQ